MNKEENTKDTQEQIDNLLFDEESISNVLEVVASGVADGDIKRPNETSMAVLALSWVIYFLPKYLESDKNLELLTLDIIRNYANVCYSVGYNQCLSDHNIGGKDD